MQECSLSTSGIKAEKARRSHKHIHADSTAQESPLPDLHASLLEKVEVALEKHTKIIEDKLAKDGRRIIANPPQVLLSWRMTTSPSHLG
jgi:hypothetical protein